MGEASIIIGYFEMNYSIYSSNKTTKKMLTFLWCVIVVIVFFLSKELLSYYVVTFCAYCEVVI